MTVEDFNKFYATREWRLLRKQVACRSGGTCERCNFHQGKHVHHLTYARFGGRELISDLQHLCEHCHSYVHARSDSDPLPAAKAVMELQKWTHAYCNLAKALLDSGLSTDPVPELRRLPEPSKFGSFEECLSAIAELRSMDYYDLKSAAEAYIAAEPIDSKLQQLLNL